jgi:hypothetical protein
MTTIHPGSNETAMTVREMIKDYPGQTDPCPLCGSLAVEAPEGLHGVHPNKLLAGRNYGDPVWEFQHCFKCGYRNDTDPTAANNAQMFRQFQAWLATQMAPAQQHPTASIDAASPDEVAQLRATVEKMRADLQAAQTSSTPSGS